MYLKDLIDTLKKEKNKNKIIKNGFGNPHSYRGYYDRLAFEPKENVSVADMLIDAKKALGKTYTGWKGGEFLEYTEVYIAYKGHTGEELGPTLLAYIIKDESQE